MSRINYAINMNEETVNAISNAITWETCDMNLKIIENSIEKCNKTIKSDEATPAEVMAAEERKEELEKQAETVRNMQTEVAEAHEKFLQTVESAHNDHVQNNRDAMRNILRLSVAVDNARFESIAILRDGMEFKEFYDLFVSVHAFDAEDLQNGGIQNKAIRSQVAKTVSRLFQVPVESEYTKKIAVKFNNTDVYHMHECFVRGMVVNRSKNRKANTVNIDGGDFNYAIKKIEKKDGTVDYKGETFMKTLAQIAILHLFS